MKKIKILVASILCGGLAYGQAPTGAPPVNPANVSLTARSAWYKGGNDNNGAAPNNNIFGTMWNSPIYTYTNGINRMTIFGGGTGTFGGRVALGNNLPATFVPQARLHLHQTGGGVFTRYTNGITGLSSGDGFLTGISGFGTAYLKQLENKPIIFQSNWKISPGFLGERMRISSINSIGVPHPIGLPDNTTRVSISLLGNSPVTAPRSLLHLGVNAPTGGGGWRDWMNVGTYYAQATDNMYVGWFAKK